jgi:hypothetical protein
MYELRPTVTFKINICVAVASHAAGVKIEPAKVGQVICIEKAKDLVIKGFKFRFQKILADNMERWCSTNTKCKCCIKCSASREIFGAECEAQP